MILVETTIKNGWLESKPITDSSKILSMRVPAYFIQGKAKDYLEKYYNIQVGKNSTCIISMVKPATEQECKLEVQKLAARIECARELFKGE